MAQDMGVRIYQYLDDQFVRATTHQICFHHTQTLVVLCHELNWIVNVQNWNPSGYLISVSIMT